SSRAVSEERSTSESPRSVTKPATSTRRKLETSSFDWRGVSTGTSMKLAHAPAARAARPSSRRLGLLLGFAVSLVIGLAEQVVVLLDVQAARLDLQGLLVGLPGFGEIALLLEGDREVVQRLGGLGLQGHGFLETEAGFLPEALACDLDAEAQL